MRRLVVAALLAVNACALAGGPPADPASAASPTTSAVAAADVPVADVPVRSVRGQVLTSTALPAVSLRFGDAFRFVGTQSFLLYGVARAEQYVFVDADDAGLVRRLYLVQFEGYLPDNTYTYDYPVTRLVRVGGLPFIADADARNVQADAERPDSDTCRLDGFLAAHGYRLPSDEVLSERLVHLVDAEKRREVMVLYSEDLGRFGCTAAELAEGGRAAVRWPELEELILRHALKGLQVEH